MLAWGRRKLWESLSATGERLGATVCERDTEKQQECVKDYGHVAYEWGKQMYVCTYQLRFDLAASNTKGLKQKTSSFPFLVLSKAGNWQLASVTAPQSSEFQQALSVVLPPILNIKLYLRTLPI